jgi:membrane protease YdiL (CAAX protease family)
MLRQFLVRIGALEATPPWSAFAALSSIAVSFAALVMGTFVALALLNDKQYTTLVAWTSGAVVTIIFIFVRFSKADERAALRLSGSSSTTQQIFMMLLIGVGMSVALDVISGRVTGVFLPEPELLRLYNDTSLYQQPVSGISWIFAVIFMVAAQPVAEELVFRGVLLSSVRALIGAWPGYITSAILYAVFHLLAFTPAISNFIGLWYGQILPFVAGLIFGAVRLYTGSTRAAIWAHVGFGLFAVVKMLTLIG